MLAARAARVRAYAPALVGSAAVGALCIQAILARAGGPAFPLDDAFIHLQFARGLAEGRFYEYVAGEGYSSGATSLLWPLVLAPFHLIGVRGISLVWVAWALGALSHAGVAVETARLARPLVGRAGAAGAGAMSVAFAAFAWFGFSGMETVAFAWILARTARVAAGWCEPAGREPPVRSLRGGLGLALLGGVAPLVRPEGVIASVLAAAALAYRPPVDAPRLASWRGRLLGLAPLAGVALGPALHWAMTGHPGSSTTAVKWLVGNPSYQGGALWAAIGGNVWLLVTDVLNGGPWTALFLPEGSSVPLLLGALALPVAGFRRRRPMHAVAVAVVALGTLLPCTYLSFLWNRVRYVWPFAPAWFVMVACFARELGDLAVRFRRDLTYVTPLFLGVCAGGLAARLPWAVYDLAQSAHAIDQQQVRLGRWAAEHLPADALIGVNDTGAIAYFAGRRTFDVVGLTTEGEARYWVEGAGSRFEHYERLPPERRPTHFIVYPHWMACPPVLGEELTEATVLDQTILGGTTMIAYEARYDALGSGAAPVRLWPGERVLDAIDVADLESEEAHAYARGGGTDQDNRVLMSSPPHSDAPGGSAAPLEIADGGRFERKVDRFVARLPGAASAATSASASARLVLRVASDDGARLAITAAGEPVGEVEIPPGDWVERSIALPPGVLGSARDVDRDALHLEVGLRRGAAFHAYHYWVVGPG